MDFARLNDSCLKHGFRLQINLSEIRGRSLNGLVESLNFYSMQVPNMRIIERIMYNHPRVFRNPESIKEIMRKDEPVISAFTIMGNTDRNCTLKWLILSLEQLREYLPLRNILVTAPPTVVLRSPSNTQIAFRSGQTIEFEIRTISQANIQWFKHCDDRAEVILDHIHVNEFSMTPVSYKTKESDRGYFYIQVTCNGFRETSSWIYVGTDEISGDDRKKYEVSNKQSSESTEMTSTSSQIENRMSPIEIIPSQETIADGKKRVALLVGVMDYRKLNISNLKAPETDILNLERVILQMGFTAYCFGDLNLKQMTKVLNQFSDTCIDDNTYVFFYFAGHGKNENKMDYIQLNDSVLSVKDVLNILVRKKPRSIVAIFDTCRDNSNENAVNNNSGLYEASIPIGGNLILVMSTLPTQKAFEKPVGYDNTSLIMKTLCEALKQYGCRNSISLVMTHFINKYENISQRPTISAVGSNDIIGINQVIPRFKPKIRWLQTPQDIETMRYLTVDFKIFHNILNIYLDAKSNHTVKKLFIEISSMHQIDDRRFLKREEDANYKIDLFHFAQTIKAENGLFIDFCVLLDAMHKFTIEIQIPKEILPFLELQ